MSEHASPRAHPRAIILCAHGSREPGWRTPIEAVAQHMRTLAPDTPVACAYLAHCPPSLEQAAATLIAQGASAIAIWPMFLGNGGHVRTDLPRLVQTLRTRHLGVHIQLHPAIAEHPLVLHAMAQAALGHPPGNR